jgi:xanthine dehydrogenase accessory factor
MIFDILRETIAAEQPVALATVVAGDQLGAKLLIRPDQPPVGSLGSPEVDAAVSADALALLDAERSEARAYAGDTATVLIETYPPPPHLVIVGAVHTAIPLTTCAKQLGFRVTVVDPRAAFATHERFPDADELVVEWPDEALPQLRLDRSTYIAVLTHDPKLDDPAVRIALAYPVRYVGAIGSPKTQAARRAALRESGISAESLERIYGPIGLPLGSKTPAEIAVSILAEMIAVRRGKIGALRGGAQR